MNSAYYHLSFDVDAPPHTRRFAYDDEPRCGDAVEFRLVYDGRLPSQSRKDTRVSEKHEIRKIFHKQLKALWAEHPGLSRFKTVGGEFARYETQGFSFAPLISEEVGGAFAQLDILFLRRNHPGGIVSQGDIDNRVKVLFDALRIPKKAGELESDAKPEEGEDPFLCLLDDDSLITSVNITTDRLLTPFTGNHKHPLNDTLLVIHVKTGVFSWRNHSETFA